MDFYNYPDVNRAHKYALGVVNGDTLACKQHRQACERYLKDLTAAGQDGFDYYFDLVEASRCCAFLQMLVHTKGKWKGKPIYLEDWQCFIVANIFGWRNKKTHLRRFTEAFLLIPRKNGKSLLAAGIGLLMLTVDDENGPEVYCGASSEKQAWEVFRPAQIMARLTPDFTASLDVKVNAQTIVTDSDDGRFEPVIGDPADGASPSCFICDERHEHKNNNMYETARTGMGAREQPLLLTITTAGSTLGGVCYEQQRNCEKVLSGSFEDENLFVMIFGIDPEDDWTNLDSLRKANPNLGVSVLADRLEKEQLKAMQDPSKVSAFKTKHLNVWVGASKAWMNMVKWNQCADKSIRIEDFEGEQCITAVDLASRNDFAAYTRIFPVKQDKKTNYYVFTKFYLPEETILNDRQNRLQPWVDEGWLTSTEGSEIDFDVIEADILDDDKKYKVAARVYDNWQAQQFSTNLKKKGIEMESYGNGPSKMNEPMQEVFAAVLSGRLIHDGNPILTWMASNVVAKSTDGGDTIRPVKEAAVNKIDGMVTLIMSVGAYINLKEPEEEKKSVYATRGIRTL